MTLGRPAAAARPAHRRGAELHGRALGRRDPLALDAPARATSATTPLLHAALLAYASDYLLLDMAFRSHPERDRSRARSTGFSLDHAIWFHRPVRFDRWHLHTQETLAISGHRGLVRGAIHDADGHLGGQRHAGGPRAAYGHSGR